MPIIKDKVIDIVVMESAGAVDEGIAGFVEILGQKTFPLAILKGYSVETL